MVSATSPDIRYDWTIEEIETLHALPLLELVFRAQVVHRQHHAANQVQLSTLLSIKTGGCSEDCGYCSQSARHKTAIDPEPILDKETVVSAAKAAKDSGSTRFCMGAAWRTPPSESKFNQVLALVKEVRSLGMETCVTLGMLSDDQAKRLAEVGLDYYNHNLDTSPEYYPKVISTRTYDDRLQTLERVREAGIALCCGGIIGMGEDSRDICSLLRQLATMKPHPESVPINTLVAVAGTPMEGQAPIEPLELVRTIALARLLMPNSYVRLSAGRRKLSQEAHALAFLAGANSIFAGEKLLTTPNPGEDRDRQMLETLGLKIEAGEMYV